MYGESFEFTARQLQANRLAELHNLLNPDLGDASLRQYMRMIIILSQNDVIQSDACYCLQVH